MKKNEYSTWVEMRIKRLKRSGTKDTRKEGKPRLSKGRTSLVVQWLIPLASNAAGLNSTPGQETRPHMQQRKSLHAATKTQHSQMDKLIIIIIIINSTKSLALRSDTVVK